MPDVEMSLEDLLDEYVGPIIGDGVLVTVKNMINENLLDTKVKIPIPSDIIDSLTGGGGDDSGGDDGGWQSNNLPPIPPLVPIEPKAAMNAIAAAVRDAEKILNMENLAIGGAGIDVSLVVDVAGVAGANANFKITIGPTPRP